eukprot:UN05176
MELKQNCDAQKETFDLNLKSMEATHKMAMEKIQRKLKQTETQHKTEKDFQKKSSEMEIKCLKKEAKNELKALEKNFSTEKENLQQEFEEKLKDYKETAKRATSQLEFKAKHLEEIKGFLDEQRKLTSELELEKNANVFKIAALKKDKTHIEMDLKACQGLLKQAKSDALEVEKLNKDKRQKWWDERNELQNQARILESKIGDYDFTIAKSKKTVSRSEKRQKSLEKSNEAFEQLVEQQKDEVKKVRDVTVELRKEISGLNLKLTQIEGEKDDVLDQLKALQKTKDELNEKIEKKYARETEFLKNEWESEKKRHEMDFETLKKKSDHKQQQYNSSTEKLHAELMNLQNELHEITDNKRKIENSLRVEITKHKCQFVELNESHIALKQNYEKKTVQIETFKKEKQDMFNKTDTLENTINTKSLEINKLKREINDLNHDIKASQSEIQDKSGSIANF